MCVCIYIYCFCYFADMVSDDKEDDIEFVVITRSAATNPLQFAPFNIIVDKYDPMAIIREKIVFKCHTSYDIAMDKLVNANLKIVAESYTAIFRPEHDDMEIDEFLGKHQMVGKKFKIVMPLNLEGSGGGT